MQLGKPLQARAHGRGAAGRGRLLVWLGCAGLWLPAVRAEEGLQAVVVGVQRMPTAAIGSAAAYDTKRGSLIVFGGYDPGARGKPPPMLRLSSKTGDWSEVCVAGPAPTAFGFPSLVYEPKRDALFLFGGWAYGARQPSGELWKLALGGPEPLSWERVAAGEGAWPSARNGAVLVVDAARDRLILFGGDGGPKHPFGYTPLADLWAFDLGSGRWHELKASGDAPPPRWNHAGAVDSASGRLFVFGGSGYADGEPVLDPCVYALDLRTLRWRRFPANGPHPAPLQGGRFTFDPRYKVLVMAGGLLLGRDGPAGTPSLWVFDPAGGAWKEYPKTLRFPRRDYAAAYDPVRGEHLILGGDVPVRRGSFFARGKPLRQLVRIRLEEGKSLGGGDEPR